MPSKQSDPSAVAEPAKPSSRLRRLMTGPGALVQWAGASYARTAAVAALVAAMLGGLAAIAVLVLERPAIQPPVTLDMALEALDNGDRVEARRIAERLQRDGLPEEQWAGPPFILGALAYEEATTANDKRSGKSYRQAAGHLEEAHRYGFLPGRKAEGMYLYAMSLFQSGKLAESRPVLEKALKSNPRRRTEIHRCLAEAWLSESPPALDKALAENGLYLAAEAIPADERDEGMLLRAEIFFRLNRESDSTRILDKIDRQSRVRGGVAVLRGRILYQEAVALKKSGGDQSSAAVREKLKAASDLFRAAQGYVGADDAAVRQATYMQAMCLLESGDSRAALALWSRMGKLVGDTPEGLAAAFREAETARRLGEDTVAVMAYRRVLTAPIEWRESRYTWLTLKEIQTGVMTACQDYTTEGKYALALQVARLLHPLVPKRQALETMAQVYRAWGQSLLGQAERLPPDKAEVARRESCARFRKAGDQYAELARTVFVSRQYPEQVWNSAVAYLQGKDYQRGIRMLRIYLRNESKKRHSLALVEMGEAYVAMNEWDKALDALRQCVEQHPRDAVTYRARLLASKAAAAKGDAKAAEAFLLENLNGESLSPASKEWRDSLFALGELLHQQGRYAEAQRRLEEAVARYPDAPQTLLGRYLIATACSRSAHATRAVLEKEGASSRDERAVAARRQLRTAFKEYETILDSLGRRDDREMTQLEKAILRNSRFAVGEVYQDLEQYEQALQAYTDAANHYPDAPEVLDAYLAIAGVFQRLGRPSEARTSIEQARVALQRIPGDAPFENTTNYSRQQWNEVLDWMGKL